MRVHGRTAALAAILLAAAGLATAFGPRVGRTIAAMAGSQGSTTSSAATLPVRRAPSTIPAAARRPVWRRVAGDSLGSIGGFTRLGDTLVVLDPMARRVLLLRVRGDEWHPVGGWGRRGGGPGEFQRPAAIAALSGDTIAVAEESGRVQLFTADGRHQRTEDVGFPCTMALPAIAYEADGTRWLSGLCAGARPAADTIFQTLFTAPPGGEYTEVLRVARLTFDLRWGETYATTRPLSDAGDAAWLGIGLGDCLHDLVGGRASERCALIRERLSSPPPEGLEEDRRRAKRSGDERMLRGLRWPESLPAYFGIVRDADGSTVLARPISGDTMVLVPAGEPFDHARVRLVAPMRPFLQCVRGACLWFDAERGAIALHDATGADAAGPRTHDALHDEDAMTRMP